MAKETKQGALLPPPSVRELVEVRRADSGRGWVCMLVRVQGNAVQGEEVLQPAGTLVAARERARVEFARRLP